MLTILLYILREKIREKNLRHVVGKFPDTSNGVVRVGGTADWVSSLQAWGAPESLSTQFTYHLPLQSLVPFQVLVGSVGEHQESERFKKPLQIPT